MKKLFVIFLITGLTLVFLLLTLPILFKEIPLHVITGQGKAQKGIEMCANGYMLTNCII